MRRVAGVVEAEIDGERVLLAPATLAYFSLNQVGARVWDLIGSEGRSLPGLVDVLVAEFDVDPATCRRDVSDFVEAATTAGVLTSGDLPAGS